MLEYWDIALAVLVILVSSAAYLRWTVPVMAVSRAEADADSEVDRAVSRGRLASVVIGGFGCLLGFPNVTPPALKLAGLLLMVSWIVTHLWFGLGRGHEDGD
jgi:hypothetical protein